MARLRFLVLLGLLYLHTVVANVYEVIITSGFSGTTDKVSIILVGQGGAQTRVHDLPGTFPKNSVKFFRVTDWGVGAVSAVKIRLTQKRYYKDFWYLEQVIVDASGKYFTFYFKDHVKYNQWNIISPKCRKGFRKLPDGTCVDIDECKDSGSCADKVATCHNNIGSFSCSCPFGYNTDYPGRCQDVNECRYDNGKCQELCHNSPGSYRCGCYRSGYKLVDGFRCVDIDECTEGKDNCDRVSATCRNSPGGFACYCKPGYSRKDASSCERVTCPSFSADRDSHGTLKPARCFQQGQNKYQDRCILVCDHGYVPYTPSAVNASCGPYRNWVPYPTTCIGRPCPKLVNIDNGYVQWACRHMIRRYGHTCQYTCNNGYKLKGNAYRECQADGTWSGTEPTCEKVYPKPEITCPQSISVILKPGRNTSDVGDKWRRPTALYAENITAVDPPGVNSNYRFPPGKTIVKWVAVNAVGKQDSCVVQVEVLDRENPKVVFCPRRIFKVYYGSGPVWVNMTKPVFTDNVGVASYHPPLIDGVSTSMTRHFTFKAYDAAGNSADCKVAVYVGGYRCQLPPEGPPDGKWTCSTFGQVKWCTRACAAGQQPFGASSYWMCYSNIGKWQRGPQPIPVRHCVGYTNVNASLQCAVGSVRNTSTGFTGCFECPIGTYFHSDNCEACAERMFQDQTGQTSCKSCPSGTSSFKGSWNCRPMCPSGRYSKDGLGPFCDFCSNGTYQDKHQQTSCIQCPSGTYTLHIGATFCGKSPQITNVEPGSSVSVSAGGNAVIKCFSHGVPTPSVYWQYPVNGKGSKTQSLMKDKDGKLLGTQLSITNASSSDDGAYTCVSANTHGEITRSVQVTVTKPSSKKSTLEDIDMAITMDERTLRAANDQCPAGKYSATGLGPLCRVCPKDSYQDQAGMTACKNCTSGMETLQLAAASPADCGVAPTITNVSSSVNTTNLEATLDCYADGSPSPLVTWHFIEDVPSDFLGLPKLEQLVDDKGKPTGTRMIIRAVTRYNTGRYECTAVNPYGQDKKTLDLDVWQI